MPDNSSYDMGSLYGQVIELGTFTAPTAVRSLTWSSLTVGGRWYGRRNHVRERSWDLILIASLQFLPIFTCFQRIALCPIRPQYCWFSLVSLCTLATLTCETDLPASTVLRILLSHWYVVSTFHLPMPAYPRNVNGLQIFSQHVIRLYVLAVKRLEWLTQFTWGRGTAVLLGTLMFLESVPGCYRCRDSS